MASLAHDTASSCHKKLKRFNKTGQFRTKREILLAREREEGKEEEIKSAHELEREEERLAERK